MDLKQFLMADDRRSSKPHETPEQPPGRYFKIPDNRLIGRKQESNKDQFGQERD